jgi:adenine deaminase
MLDMLIHGGRVVTPAEAGDWDVGIAGERIVAVAFPGLFPAEATQVIDARGKIIVPGGIETHGIHCRTFHIDPSGRLLVAAHIRPLLVREGTTVRRVPACLSMFRIGDDGKLASVRKYDVDVGNNTMFWMGMV